jgi:hypothetical protein
MEYTISKEAYEGDIVSRLRNWRGLHLAHGGRLFDEAAGEIERLRGDLEVRRLQLEAAAGEVEKLHSRLRLADAALRSESPTLTDAEREAIAAGLGALERLYEDSPPISQPIYEQHAPTLRRLLERLK